MKLPIGLLFFVTIISFTSSRLLACSICSCGDPSSSVCHYPGYEAERGWLLGLDSKYFSKTNHDNGSREEHTQSQLAAAVRYYFNNNFSLYGRVPLVKNEIKIESPSSSSRVSRSGLGDSEILARYRFKTNYRGWYPAAALALKIPTGNNDLKQDVPAQKQSSLDHGSDENTGRLSEHAQLGSGAFDTYLILSAARQGTYYWKIEAGFRYNGENDYRFQGGSVAWQEVSVAREVVNNLTLMLGSRFRESRNDEYGKLKDYNSGGFLAAGALEARYEIVNKLFLFTNILTPVYENLNGDQTENPMWGAGLVLNY